MDSIKEEVRQYILTEFLPGEDASNLQYDTSLRAAGVLDSVATLRLVDFIEERFGIEVQAREAGGENFNTIDRIAAFIQTKKAN